MLHFLSYLQGAYSGALFVNPLFLLLALCLIAVIKLA